MLILYCTAPVIPTSRLREKDLSWIYNVLCPNVHITKWTQLAQRLKLTEDEVSNLRQYPTDKFRLTKMLSKWLGQSRRDNMGVNLQTLLKAISNTGIEVNNYE